MADSSNAGFIVADSTNASAWAEISANLRNQRIFCLMSCLARSMLSFVSISYAVFCLKKKKFIVKYGVEAVMFGRSKWRMVVCRLSCSEFPRTVMAGLMLGRDML